MPRALLLPFALLLACTPEFHSVTASPATSDADDSDSDATPTGGPACVNQFDCPRLGVCEAVDCVDGECIYGDALVDDDPFDDVEPEGPSGDCKRMTCTAKGEMTEVDDPNDAPEGENLCSLGTCDPGPKQQPAAPNEDCSGLLDSAPSYCWPDTSCHFCEYVAPNECDADGDEPSETQETARDLGEVDDADLFEKYVRCATLGSASDVDWFKFHGSDSLLGVIDPMRSLYDAGGGARLCVFFACDTGGTEVACAQGEPDTAPGGQPGCCGAGQVVPTLTCADNYNYSADVWLRVDQGPAACTPYELRYNF
ncbi:MAG TPA: hypothetical protein VGB85_03985 [Nannocystis sp.]|jgi:hypothetical protein